MGCVQFASLVYLERGLFIFLLIGIVTGRIETKLVRNSSIITFFFVPFLHHYLIFPLSSQGKVLNLVFPFSSQGKVLTLFVCMFLAWTPGYFLGKAFRALEFDKGFRVRFAKNACSFIPETFRIFWRNVIIDPLCKFLRPKDVPVFIMLLLAIILLYFVLIHYF